MSLIPVCKGIYSERVTLSPGQSIHVGPAYMEASGWLHAGWPHVMAACSPQERLAGRAGLCISAAEQNHFHRGIA